MLLISIGDMRFRMILSDGVGSWPGNLWWGMVPKTGTKAKLDKYRKNSRTGIMKILDPLLREAVVKLIKETHPSLFTIVGTTSKAENLYRSWAKYIESKTGYQVDNSYNRGILIRKPKSKNKINEEQLKVQPERMIELIKRDCKPWLEQSEGNLVYRGIRDEGTFVKKKVRKDRKPLGTSKFFHDYAEDKMKKTGLKARRKNSIFVTGSLSVARSYGAKPYVVFPIGNFDFTWSPEVDDLFNVIPTFKSPSEQYRKFDLLVKNYIDVNLVRAIKSNNEIMVKCDSYYAIQEDWFRKFLENTLFWKK